MPADTFTPDVGQRVDAAGRVTYDFDGHITANGIDLLASPPPGVPRGPGDPVAPTDRRVGFVAESDGSTRSRRPPSRPAPRVAHSSTPPAARASSKSTGHPKS
jgi:hypothetical protein